MKINVGMLLSYDYELLKNSIPLIYKNSDSITLAKDINNKTWSGNIFKIENSFYEWLKEVDVDNKITIYEDDFFVPTLTAFENDTRERNMLSLKMPKDGWYVQIDADEYSINYIDFCNFLKSRKDLFNSKNNIQISGFWVVLYKIENNNYFYVSKPYERCFFATNKPNDYKASRNTKTRLVYYPFFTIHQSWARTEQELKYKLDNWGHKDDFNCNEYLKLWKSINISNYKDIKNFHPLNPKYWKHLSVVTANNIFDVITIFNKENKTKISSLFIFRKNLGQKIKSLYQNFI